MHVDRVQVNLRIAVSMNHGLRIEESAALCELHLFAYAYLKMCLLVSGTCCYCERCFAVFCL